jgi:hypothetical protein
MSAADSSAATRTSATFGRRRRARLQRPPRQLSGGLHQVAHVDQRQPASRRDAGGQRVREHGRLTGRGATSQKPSSGCQIA